MTPWISSVSIDTPAYATYARAKDFIEKKHRRVTNLDGIAKACNVDAPYLCRLFVRFHDESPYQFLTGLWMGDASQMMLAGDITVKAVAETLEFKDAFHFSRVYKSIHHVPPSSFRQSMHPQRH